MALERTLVKMDRAPVLAQIALLAKTLVAQIAAERTQSLMHGTHMLAQISSLCEAVAALLAGVAGHSSLKRSFLLCRGLVIAVAGMTAVLRTGARLTLGRLVVQQVRQFMLPASVRG